MGEKNKLVIVESPSKAKTLVKYLDDDNYKILASYGHVRDLVPKDGSVDPKNNFAMKYEVISKNQKHVDEICKQAKKADTIYLATDPDREGEAIAWHICEILKDKGILKEQELKRVSFFEITKKAVTNAIKDPRDILLPLVNAQQLRRALDYLYGFNLSPLLWRKVRPGLSAGRVQSAALRMVVELQEKIDKFVSKEYWSIISNLSLSRKNFKAKLFSLDGDKVDMFDINNKDRAEEVIEKVKSNSNGTFVVAKVTKQQRKRQPAGPFTTSTLQQEASRKLRFSAQKTMIIAQQLYEGIDIGIGTQGLITYMRTDSQNLSQEALEQIREYIDTTYGSDDLPEKVRVFKTKSKNAQEAHEAIRPTIIHKNPESLKSYLTSDQYKLYDLIWKRTIACQMQHAIFNNVSVDLNPVKDSKTIFRATGSTLVFSGFMKLYLEDVDDQQAQEDDENALLPVMNEGDEVKVKDIVGLQHFTQPPPKYTDASLIKALEEYGIGRPSTYASIISTLQNRGYVTSVSRRFEPTDIGKIVNKFLTNYFKNYVDYGFTASLEDQLDSVSRGETEWVPILETFWNPFIDKVKDIQETVQRKDVTQEELDENCPKCNKTLVSRLGKSGRFIGCSGYPDCDYTRSIDESQEDAEKNSQIVEGRTCPKCDSELKIRRGKFGLFVGCTKYPDCKHIESLSGGTASASAETSIKCPSCKEGNLVKRKNRFGSYFYPCSNYPKCKYLVNSQPVDKSCPNCKWPVTIIKTTKRKGTERICPEKCGFSEPAEEPASEE